MQQRKSVENLPKSRWEWSNRRVSTEMSKYLRAFFKRFLIELAKNIVYLQLWSAKMADSTRFLDFSWMYAIHDVIFATNRSAHFYYNRFYFKATVNLNNIKSDNARAIVKSCTEDKRIQCYALFFIFVCVFLRRMCTKFHGTPSVGCGMEQ